MRTRVWTWDERFEAQEVARALRGYLMHCDSGNGYFIASKLSPQTNTRRRWERGADGEPVMLDEVTL